MFVGFFIWNIVAIIFLGLGIGARKSKEPVCFFDCTNPPNITNVERYNKEVSKIWFVAASILEIIAILNFFLEQNSPLFALVAIVVVIMIIIMMIVYIKIEKKYTN